MNEQTLRRLAALERTVARLQVAEVPRAGLAQNRVTALRSVTIAEHWQQVVHGTMTVDGELILEGELILL